MSDNSPAKVKRRPPAAGKKYGGKKKRQDDPVQMAKVRRLYYLVRFEGMKYGDAYRLSHPNNKAQPASQRWQGKYIYDWYEMNFPEEIKEAQRMFGLDTYRLAKEVNDRLNATTLKNVKRVIKDKKGHEQVVEETIEVEDNATRMRATELLKDWIIGKEEKGPAIGVVVLIPDPRVEKPVGSGE